MSGGGAGNFGTCCSMGLYLDGATYNVTVSGNVFTGVKSACYLTHGGGNHFVNNLCDIGAGVVNYIAIDVWADGTRSTGGNTFYNNVVVTNQSGGGAGYDGQNFGGTVNKMLITNNAYFNYGGSSMVPTGINGAANNDTNPTYENPSINCSAVGIAAGSPAFNSPVSFPGINGKWGPPGFVVPQTGTAPSWPHGC